MLTLIKKWVASSDNKIHLLSTYSVYRVKMLRVHWCNVITQHSQSHCTAAYFNNWRSRVHFSKWRKWFHIFSICYIFNAKCYALTYNENVQHYMPPVFKCVIFPPSSEKMHTMCPKINPAPTFGLTCLFFQNYNRLGQ